MTFKKKQHRHVFGTDMEEEDIELTYKQFKVIDKDHSGYIDWWEFLKHESRRYLARRDEVTTFQKILYNIIQISVKVS